MMYNTTFISYLNNSFTLFITDFIYLHYEKRKDFIKLIEKDNNILIFVRPY